MRCLMTAAAVLAFVTHTAVAASGAVYKDRNNECYLWLCIPGSFASAECRAAVRDAFIDRINVLKCHRGKCVQVYRNLPDFSHCIDANPEGVEDATEEAMQGHKYAMTHEEYFKVTIPVHNVCTSWSGYDNESGRCLAVREIPERTYYTKDSTRITYEHIEVGWYRYEELNALMWTITEVYGDDGLYGDPWEERIQ